MLLLAAGAVAAWLAASSGKLPSSPQHVADVPADGMTELAGEQFDALDLWQMQQAFDAQEKRDYTAADLAMASVKDNVLQGHLLAERYLHPRTTTNEAQLTSWLAAYADLPQASRIHALARRKAPDAEVAEPLYTSSLKGNAGNGSLSVKTTPDGWNAAIKAFSEQSYALAAQRFATIAANASLSEHHRSAAHFWTARANEKLGLRRSTREHLRQAAAAPRSFYGQLALRTLGKDAPMVKEASSKVTRDYASMHRRAAALVLIGHPELAEAELRQAFFGAGSDERATLAAMAGELRLAALEMRFNMALHNDRSVVPVGLYPTPAWEVTAEATVDPALIYAIARQESGFRNGAKSHAGASGIMQLMPNTAKAMARSLDAEETSFSVSDLRDPATSVAVAQNYIEHLSGLSSVNGDLLRTLVAYNAGPGTLERWMGDSAMATDDPLLFIERIPYGETRNYVMNVLANYWIYTDILHGGSSELNRLAKGEWPRLHQPDHDGWNFVGLQRAGFRG